LAHAPVLAPELVRQSVTLTRALVAAARTWSLYPPEHPACAAAIDPDSVDIDPLSVL